MGWNSFDSYGLHLDEQAALDNLEFFASRLAPHGYQYFVIDGGWYNEYELIPGTLLPRRKEAIDRHLDSDGHYLPSATYFPHGLAPIIERCHELGLRFGLHIMRGIPRKAVALDLPIGGTPYTARDVADTADVCEWSECNYGINIAHPGGQAYYDGWIGLLASWGVDFIKADDITGFPAEIEALSTAIERSGRPILLSLSPGAVTDPRHVEMYRRADTVRITADIWDSREDLDRAFAAWRVWQDIGGDGLWPDLDMLCLGHLLVRFGNPADNGEQAYEHGRGRERMCLLTPEQQRTFITMRALAASPLFMGGDLPSSDKFTYALLANPHVLECNQNGVVGRLSLERDGMDVWTSPSRDGWGGWFGVFNRTKQPQSISLGVGDIGLAQDATRLYDAWTANDLGPHGLGDCLVAELASDDVLFARYDY
jgi:alpha-galactosidase